MKVALVHDWLIHMRGGEKVLGALAELYPEATIYTLFCDRKKLSPILQRRKIKVSFLQYLPGIRSYYRWLLPLFPMAIRSISIDDCDLVISSSHCVAKGARLPARAHHICYCHTPMRYLWGFEEDYFGNFLPWVRLILKGILSRLRKWDLEINVQVDQFVANSENVRSRIAKFYGRDAAVIYPPLDTEQFRLEGKSGDYYLVVSAFVPYKRIDLVIDAFNGMERDLKIVGDGPLAGKYRRMAANPRISFLGAVESRELRSLYAGARALVFPTDEDFGIVPLEAQSCGTPVIAFRKGGALESVKHGIFFESQTAEAIRQAVREFEQKAFERTVISESVRPFDKAHFKDHFDQIVKKTGAGFEEGAGFFHQGSRVKA
jgi:glycosyltransferase involved in cell wall biosynthesis